MNDEFYLIKEASAKIGVEAHVLRYWEEELKMDIHRNAMGHRYYTGKDIEILSKVNELKKKGLQLKAIRNYLELRREQIGRDKKEGAEEQLSVVEEKQEIVTEKEPAELVTVKQHVLTNEEKLEQFQQIMNRILSTAIKENNELLGKSVGEHTAIEVVHQLQGMTKEQEQRAEERYQKLDQTLREIQRARMEAAAANMRPIDKRRKRRLKRKETSLDNVNLQKMDKESEDLQEKA